MIADSTDVAMSLLSCVSRLSMDDRVFSWIRCRYRSSEAVTALSAVISSLSASSVSMNLTGWSGYWTHSSFQTHPMTVHRRRRQIHPVRLPREVLLPSFVSCVWQKPQYWKSETAVLNYCYYYCWGLYHLRIERISSFLCRHHSHRCCCCCSLLSGRNSHLDGIPSHTCRSCQSSIPPWVSAMSRRIWTPLNVNHADSNQHVHHQMQYPHIRQPCSNYVRGGDSVCLSIKRKRLLGFCNREPVLVWITEFIFDSFHSIYCCYINDADTHTYKYIVNVEMIFIWYFLLS